MSPTGRSDPDQATIASSRDKASSNTKELIEALALSGWDGFLDVEIFSQAFWALDVDEAARQAYAAISVLR